MKLPILILFLTTAASLAHAQQPREPVISLERTGCLGYCPSYTLTIYEDGMVIYNGRAYVSVKGTHVSKISTAQLESLVNRFLADRFFELEESRGFVVDVPLTITTFVHDGRKKTIKEAGTASPSLRALQDEIDRTTDSVRWVGRRRHKK